MILRNTITFGIIAVGLFSCSEKTGPITEDKANIEHKTNEQEDEKAESSSVINASGRISFVADAKFSITTNMKGEEARGVEEFDIFLHNDEYDAPLVLCRDINYNEVDPSHYDDIPDNIAFVFSTWFAGGGAVYYGIVRKGVLQVYRKFEDEMMSSPSEFELYRELDPNVKTELPTYFIQYSPDDKRGADIMIACSSDGKGLYAKYKGQIRHINMQFMKDESEGKNIIQLYNEVVNGEVNGTYKMTHSGNWDYLQYVYKSSDKNYDFTINHDATIVGDTYRTSPSF